MGDLSYVEEYEASQIELPPGVRWNMDGNMNIRGIYAISNHVKDEDIQALWEEVKSQIKGIRKTIYNYYKKQMM